ncbi:Protein atz-1 [Caenorhabditis elegans]|uniref:Protein atz-1 n=1 Tax=Caenorhabditis elegans TaxID=6239 RepID=ATZ1_CAEEL|nr:Protein atz-1 [Caenorhabditis elegans]Q19872.1 RecName: Full=Protein atz-1; AltName: Full=Abnormal transition zone 1 [Caenorhabditis elegans]CAA94596.1 Protein atz-1 [Caenorhabditis elegans]|eukprot:NP_502359.1 Uncharacterized protein CELE_F28D1.2 [Caenorhabditis elegans]
MASIELRNVQTELAAKNLQFKVLTEKFLEQRKELFDAKKTDSNVEYVECLSEKLRVATERISDLEKETKEGKQVANEEIGRLEKLLREAQQKRDAKIDESYQTFLRIELLVANLGESTDPENEKRIKNLMPAAKTGIPPEGVLRLTINALDSAARESKKKTMAIESLTKQVDDANKLTEVYMKRLEELEDKHRFEEALTLKIQAMMIETTGQLEAQKKIIADLQKKNDDLMKEEEGEEDYEEEENYEVEEDFEDEEEYDEEGEEEDYE